MSQGFAYKCDQCGRMEFAMNGGVDKLGRATQPAAGWIALVEAVAPTTSNEFVTRDPERHFCERKCLLGWLWEETKGES